MGKFFVAMLAGIFVGALAVEILKKKRPKILKKTGKLMDVLERKGSRILKT